MGEDQGLPWGYANDGYNYTYLNKMMSPLNPLLDKSDWKLYNEHRCQHCQAYIPMCDEAAAYLNSIKAEVYCPSHTQWRHKFREQGNLYALEQMS